MKLPLDLTAALPCVVAETANMSYPAAMSRGKKPVVAKHTKEAVRQHFIACFPTFEVWQQPSTVAATL
jgi:hypothetical protein